MGGYFITNCKDENRLSLIIKRLNKKGIDYSIVKKGTNTIINFKKICLPEYNNTFSNNEEYLIGVGTFFYNGKFADEALPDIFKAYKKNSNVFAEVLGHFNFIIIEENNQINIVSDKTGHYHAYYAYENGQYFISTSFFAVCDCINQLLVNKQSIYEFISNEATFGQQTIFQNVIHLPSGQIIKPENILNCIQYYFPKDVKLNFREYIEELNNYFDIFTRCKYSISCDLSGGYDTRTIAAILNGKYINNNFYTNTNINDSKDHIIAKLIAEKSKKLITTFDLNSITCNEDDILECLYILELSRDIYRSVKTPRIFQKDATDANILIGGYGGELLRSRNYNYYGSLEKLVKGNYCSISPYISKKENIICQNEIKKKFCDTLENSFEQKNMSMKEISEKLYYFEKMKYWGGSRLSAYNQYAFRIHPLLDHKLAKYQFEVPLIEKYNGNYQKRVITHFDINIAKIISSYGYSMEYFNSTIIKSIFVYLSIYCKQIIYALAFIWQNLRNLLIKNQQNESYFNFGEDYNDILKEIVEIDIKKVREDSNYNVLMRYYSINAALLQYRSKIFSHANNVEI